MAKKIDNTINKTSDMVERPPIAVVGISALCPGADSTDGFLRVVFEGEDQIREVPTTRFPIDDYYDPDLANRGDKTYCRRGAFIDPVPFDPMEFGIPPSVIDATDSCQLLTLLKAKEVVEDAGVDKWAEERRERVSVILGAQGMTQLQALMMSRTCWTDWIHELVAMGMSKEEAEAVAARMNESQPTWQEMSFPGFLGNIIAGRVTNRLDFGGTNYIVDAACASSLAAMSSSLNELYLGQCDLAITGGADLLTDVGSFISFSKSMALSRRGDCRPFSAEADGTVIGEGIVLIALRRLADAERDGDPIYAVIRGHGTSSDGKGSSIYAPRTEGQVRAMSRAYDAAGYAPQTVELIEAHGTGTPLGDATEVRSMSKVFGGEGRERNCALGSVKSQIGHAKTSAGAVALLKMVTALRHKAFPPSLKVEEPNEALLEDDCPLYVNTQARPWISDGSHPRRAGLSAFGFGGTNAHLTVEEYTGDGAVAERRLQFPVQMFLFGGGDRDAVFASAREVVARLEAGAAFDGVAKDTQLSFSKDAGHRLALVAENTDALNSVLEKAEKLIASTGGLPPTFEGAAYTEGRASTGDVAFLFPGQGSQYVGMAGELAIHFDDAVAPWNEDAVRARGAGAPGLHDYVFPQPALNAEAAAEQETALRATEITQPALALASLSYLNLLKTLKVSPDMAIGHSFGEVLALHAAGAFDAKTAIDIARKRGALMRDAGKGAKGAMTAVTLDRESVQAAIADSGAIVSIANDNAPKQVVVSGLEAEIAKLEAALSPDQYRRLPVSSAFHSPVVASSAATFRDYLGEVLTSPPSMPVIANVSATPYKGDAAACRELLSSQIASSVLFVDSIKAAYDAGVRTFIEVGPGNVLTRLVGQCLEGCDHAAVALDSKKRNGVAAFFQGLAQLAINGVALDLEALWAERRVGSAEAPKPLAKHVVWVDSSMKRRSESERLEDKPAVKRSVLSERNKKGAGAEIERPMVARGADGTVPTSSDVASEPMVNGAAAGFEPAHVEQRPEVNGQAVTGVTMADGATPPRNGMASMQADDSEIRSDTMQASVMEAPSAPTPIAAIESASEPVAPQYEVLNDNLLEALYVEASATQQQFIEAMAQSHGAFLDMTRQVLGSADASPRAMPEHVAVAPTPMPAQVAAPVAAPAPMMAQPAASAPSAPMPSAPSPTPAAPMTPPSPAPQAAKEAEAASAPVEPVAAEPAANTDAPSVTPEQLAELAIEVIADKTGYPADMLDDGMELEGDLGVDSIRRVEIFMGLRDRVPGLMADASQADQATIADLKTIGDIVGFLKENAASLTGDSASAAPAAPSAPAPSEATAANEPSPPPAAGAGAVSAQVESAILEVVADKTGYPTDLLEMDMQLEADLGVDSIKRMEILMAMGDKLPGQMPKPEEIDVGAIANLVTLKDVCAFLIAAISGDASAPTSEEGTGESGTEAASETSAQIVSVDGGASERVERFVLELYDSPAPGVGLPGLANDEPIVIIPDDGGVAEALASVFEKRGLTARVAASADEETSKIVYLGGLRRATGAEASSAMHLEAFKAAKAASSRLSQPGGVFVTVQDTGGDFGLSRSAGDRAWLGGLPGITKTLPHCWSDVAVKAIDIDVGERSAQETAEAIANELMTGGREYEIAIDQKGKRRAPALYQPDAVRAKGAAIETPVVDEKSVIVVSGGARGVTAACLEALAQAHKPRFVILGRTAPEQEPAFLSDAQTEADVKRALLTNAKAEGLSTSPAEIGQQTKRILATREVRQYLAKLEWAGSEVMYAPVDVRDANSIRPVLEKARAKWGPITGLIHGAGVLADKLVVDKTPEQFAMVFETKVLGLSALLEATSDDPLKFIVTFSSVAAQFGNLGQTDYAAANEVLNKVAQAEAGRRDGKCLVRSINWGAWDGGMVSPELARHMRDRDFELIPLESGARFLCEVLENPNAGGVELVATAAANLEPLAGPDRTAARRLAVEQATEQAAE